MNITFSDKFKNLNTNGQYVILYNIVKLYIKKNNNN